MLAAQRCPKTAHGTANDVNLRDSQTCQHVCPLPRRLHALGNPMPLSSAPQPCCRSVSRFGYGRAGSVRDLGTPNARAIPGGTWSHRRRASLIKLSPKYRLTAAALTVSRASSHGRLPYYTLSTDLTMLRSPTSGLTSMRSPHPNPRSFRFALLARPYAPLLPANAAFTALRFLQLSIDAQRTCGHVTNEYNLPSSMCSTCLPTTALIGALQSPDEGSTT